MKKMNVAFFTSAARGLAHYVAHLLPEIKSDVNPYYVTYANQEVDILVKEQSDKVYQMVQNQSASSILEIVNFLKSKKIDLINLHVSDTVRRMHIQYFAIMSYAKYLKIPVCLTIHDVFTIESMYIDPAAIELLYTLGDSYIVGNESEKDKLQFYFNKKEKDITIVPHGPYTLFNKKKHTENSAKKELGVEGKKVILFFGQIRPNKGLKYLIKALPLVLEKEKDAILYVSTDLHLSTPELNDYLIRVEKSGVSKNIRMVKDYVPSDEVEKIFKAADVVVLPYTQVSQSGILNLAFAFKKPVIVSNAFSEAPIINGKMGYVFPSTDYKTLASCILKIFSMKDLGKSMGVKGYDYSINKTSWKNAAKLTYDSYKIALGKKK
ncbi:MAG: glycosyl transferase group 1 [uncultured bacterium]|nr:MAG: glycosyl transferase group 1 [uncultured bacterium]